MNRIFVDDYGLLMLVSNGDEIHFTVVQDCIFPYVSHCCSGART